MIELVSDLGGGKTTFVRGLARGMGSTDKVASPTFTISKVYQAAKLELHHFDLYRLPEPGLIQMELADVLSDPQAVVVVEWADIVHQVLPKDRLTITITHTDENSRHLHITAPTALVYAVERVT